MLVTETNFRTPYNLLQELSQGILYGIVSMENYRQMAHSGEDENVELGSFIQSVCEKVRVQLTRQAKEYGIQITGVAIRNLTFSKELNQELDKLAKDTATVQSKSMLVSQQNQMKAEETRGALAVAKMKGEADLEVAKIKVGCSATCAYSSFRFFFKFTNFFTG